MAAAISLELTKVSSRHNVTSLSNISPFQVHDTSSLPLQSPHVKQMSCDWLEEANLTVQWLASFLDCVQLNSYGF